jgi:hypothetical protein
MLASLQSLMASMKLVSYFLVATTLVLFGFSQHQDEIEFVCRKTHKATNTCHFNFKVNGANYRFVDVGCKYEKKQNELIKKVQEGSIFLAKDWKIECPAPKQ